MELEGKIWKSKKFWLVEVPSLDIMTQGKTMEEALMMIEDVIYELGFSYLPNITKKTFQITVNDYSKGVIGVSASDSKRLFSLVLKRQREKSQTTIREAADRLGSKSPNSYAQYENGKINISLDKFEDLLHAANPSTHSLLRVI